MAFLNNPSAVNTIYIYIEHEHVNGELDKNAVFLIASTLLVTLHTFVFPYITSLVKPVLIFMLRRRVSTSCLKAELCFHRFEHFACVPIYMQHIYYKYVKKVLHDNFLTRNYVFHHYFIFKI